MVNIKPIPDIGFKYDIKSTLDIIYYQLLSTTTLLSKTWESENFCKKDLDSPETNISMRKQDFTLYSVERRHLVFY